MYTPLGTGDADIAGVVTNLLDQGFEGWFTLEQDTILRASPRVRTRRRRPYQRRLPAQPHTVTGLRIGVLGASRIAEPATATGMSPR